MAIEARQLERFLELVAHHTGLFFPPAESVKLAEILAARIKAVGSGSVDSYLDFLQERSSAALMEWQELTARLTIGETYFFRDRGQFRLLRERLLPELISARTSKRSLRFWSAGCASGEEAYSLAILVRELIPRIDDWRVTVLGTDINEAALRRARRGRYSSWSFRGVAPEVLKRYFSPCRGGWALCEEIRRMVTFRYGNLVRDPFPVPPTHPGDMDLILCRNTFIYFSPSVIAGVTRKLAACLADDGYLVTGHGELQQAAAGLFQGRLLDGQVVFQKLRARQAPNPEVAEAVAREISEEGSKSILSNSGRLSPAGRKPVRRQASRATAVSTSPGPDRKPTVPQGRRIPSSSPGSSMGGSQGAVPVAPAVSALVGAARNHADRGDYQQAESLCLQALERKPTDPDIHFLLAQLAEVGGDVATAREALERTLYLDSRHIPALVELGSLCRRDSNPDRGTILHRQAYELLGDRPATDPVPEFPGLTVADLRLHLRELLGETG